MGSALTREQVVALAPDDASAKAGAALASDSKWVTLGADDGAVWGECQGSGSKPYQAQADLAGLATRCSCPSRKFPCKHGLALLLLFAQGNKRFAGSARPPWVDEWIASRRDKAVKKEVAAKTAAEPEDPEAAKAAAGKREATRWKRIESGTADLERWIADQFRRGFAQFAAEQRRDWLSMASRMVDAQAPGLAPQLQLALDAMNGGLACYGEAIERLGLLQLLNEGVRRRAQLSPARLADVRAALGWPVDKDDVLRDGEAVKDAWHVLGQVVVDVDTKLAERRVWLQGRDTRRFALLQEFAYGGRGWDAWRTGASYSATMRFFPGSVALRALAVDAVVEAAPSHRQPASIDESLDFASRTFAANPWLPQVPMVLDHANPVAHESGWRVDTAAGALPLHIDASSGWSLLAFSGGASLGLMGEWNGRALRPLVAWNAPAWCWIPAEAA